MIEELDRIQLQRVAAFLFDGQPLVYHLILQLEPFKRRDRILLWLVRNNIKGQSMVEFFQTESGDAGNKGVLAGVAKAISFIDGHRLAPEHLTLTDLK